MTQAMTARYRFVILLALAVLGADQASKAAALARIGPWEHITVIPGFFDLVNVSNYGAAFGFLNRPDWGWPSVFFAAFTCLAIVVLLWLVKGVTESDRLHLAAIGSIIGGALGNLVDRLRFGYVVDFVDLYIGRWHWPAFNVADAAICVGAGVLALKMFKVVDQENPR